MGQSGFGARWMAVAPLKTLVFAAFLSGSPILVMSDMAH